MRPFEPKNHDRDFTDEEVTWDRFGITRHDFSAHWNGDLINLFTVILPNNNVSETEDLVHQAARSIASWIIDNQSLFKPADRYQIIIGWPLSIRQTSRHITKTGGTLSELHDIIAGKVELKFYPSWHKDIPLN
jgi:hypothetical protein